MPRYRAPRIADFLALTPREREVLAAVADGFTDHELAKLFSRSPATIRMHMRSLRVKLCVSCRAHLVRVAIEAQMVPRTPLGAIQVRPQPGASVPPPTLRAHQPQKATQRAPGPWGR